MKLKLPTISLSTHKLLRKIFSWIIVVLLMLSTTPHVSAFTMSNIEYILQMGNLNSFAGRKSNAEYTVTDTGGQLAPGLYSGSNYKIRAGFQYIYSIIAFRFSISNIYIDFGTLSPTTPVTRTNTLTVSNGSAYGYQVTAFENHQLMVPASGQIIPNTTCDAGTCTTTTAAAWTNTLTYGFGYRCDNLSGTDCASGFSTSTFYKQFADESAGQTPQAVMSGTNVGRNKQSQITYKVNISGSQAAGLYQNVITYIATPTY
jgi:hypothetical protein